MTTINFKSIAALFILALFALTSCQKEDLMADLNPTSTQQLATDRNVPTSGIHFVNDEVKTEATWEMIQENVTERSRYLYLLECGADYNTTTVGEGSTLDTDHYPTCVDEYGDPFTGNDMIYHLSIPATPEAIMTHTLTLSEMEADLDLMVFALDANGRVTECKALSITIGMDDEKLEMRDMAAGCYLVVVDGYQAGVEGAYNLTLDCTAVSSNPPSISEIDINMAEYGFDGELLGAFNQISVTEWKEFGKDNSEFNFTEVGRDESSIYLRDDSRGVNIQLNTATQKVMYSDDEGNTFELYDIINSSAKVSGFLASKVTYAAGDFSSTTDKNWVESNATGTHHFVETARDIWSIYLRDEGRGINIQLDLYTKKVMYSDDAGNAFELYDILGAE
ncbi:MAG: hypothetical protein AB8G22_24460 [Saprospiraceae bacterium]